MVVCAGNDTTVHALYKKQETLYKKDPHVLVFPGGLAHRQEKWVHVFAKATGLSDKDSVEFVLISETSGYDYESLAISYATPSDIHRALEFRPTFSTPRISFLA